MKYSFFNKLYINSSLFRKAITKKDNVLIQNKLKELKTSDFIKEELNKLKQKRSDDQILNQLYSENIFLKIKI